MNLTLRTVRQLGKIACALALLWASQASAAVSVWPMGFGPLLALAGRADVRVVDLQGRLHAKLPLTGGSDSPREPTLVWLASGLAPRLWVATEHDLTVYDAATWTARPVNLPFSGEISDLKVSPSGAAVAVVVGQHLVVLGGDGTPQVRTLTSTLVPRLLYGVADCGAVLGTDGANVAMWPLVGAMQRLPASVQRVAAARGDDMWLATGTKSLQHWHFSPSVAAHVADEPGEGSCWAPPTPAAPLQCTASAVSGVQLPQTGQLVEGNFSGLTIHAAAGDQFVPWPQPFTWPELGEVAELAASPSGNNLVVSWSNGPATLHHLGADGQPQGAATVLPRVPGVVHRLGAADDGTVRILQTDCTALRLAGGVWQTEIVGTACDADGPVVRRGQELLLWHPDKPAQPLTLPKGSKPTSQQVIDAVHARALPIDHSCTPDVAAFSFDGKYLATLGEQQRLCTYEPATGLALACTELVDQGRPTLRIANDDDNEDTTKKSKGLLWATGQPTVLVRLGTAFQLRDATTLRLVLRGHDPANLLEEAAALRGKQVVLRHGDVVDLLTGRALLPGQVDPVLAPIAARQKADNEPSNDRAIASIFTRLEEQERHEPAPLVEDGEGPVRGDPQLVGPWVVLIDGRGAGRTVVRKQSDLSIVLRLRTASVTVDPTSRYLLATGVEAGVWNLQTGKRTLDLARPYCGWAEVVLDPQGGAIGLQEHSMYRLSADGLGLGRHLLHVADSPQWSLDHHYFAVPSDERPLRYDVMAEKALPASPRLGTWLGTRGAWATASDAAVSILPVAGPPERIALPVGAKELETRTIFAISEDAFVLTGSRHHLRRAWLWRRGPQGWLALQLPKQAELFGYPNVCNLSGDVLSCADNDVAWPVHDGQSAWSCLKAKHLVGGLLACERNGGIDFFNTSSALSTPSLRGAPSAQGWQTGWFARPAP